MSIFVSFVSIMIDWYAPCVCVSISLCLYMLCLDCLYVKFQGNQSAKSISSTFS